MKWTFEKIEEVRKLKMQGFTDLEIAKKLTTTLMAIRSVVRRRRLILTPELRKEKMRKVMFTRWRTEREKILQGMQKIWTPQRREKLRELIENGFHIHSKIAETLGCSKNAVDSACCRFRFLYSESQLSRIAEKSSKKVWKKKYETIMKILEEKKGTREMGYIIAVASLKGGRYSSEAKITISSWDTQFLEYFKKVFQEVMVKKLSIKMDGDATSDVPRIHIYDNIIVDIIFWRNRIRSASSYYFHKYGKDFWRGFIQGFFDVKAEVYPEKRLWQIRVFLPQLELPLLNLMKKCLRRFDIRVKKVTLGNWRLALTIISDIENVRKFRDKIGFRHSEKREKLEELIKKGIQNIFITCSKNI